MTAGSDPAYEGGVSVVEADWPVPLVAGDSSHCSNERSRYDPYGPAAAQQLSSNALKDKATTYGIALNGRVKFRWFAEKWQVPRSAAQNRRFSAKTTLMS